MQTLQELNAQLAEAAMAGDEVKMAAIIKQKNALKAEIAKAMQEQARREEEARAGLRKSFEDAIAKVVKPVLKDLPSVYELGAHQVIINLPCKHDDDNGRVGPYNPEGPVSTPFSVHLHVPEVKATRTGGIGKTRAEYGLSLDEIVQRFGTEAEKAEAEILKAQRREGRADSKLYNLQKAIKKRAIAEGKLQPLR